MLGGYAACAFRRPLPSVILGGCAACGCRGRGHGNDASVQRRRGDVHVRVSIRFAKRFHEAKGKLRPLVDYVASAA